MILIISFLIVGLVVGLLVLSRSSIRVGNVLLSVDLISALDVRALAGESDPPLGVGVVTVAGLLLAIVVVVLILDSPVEVVVRNVGVIHVLLAVGLVRVGGDDGSEGKENDGDL